MRPYRTKEYMDNLAGNKFVSSCDDLAIYTGLTVRKILRELTEKEYDRELVDESDKNMDGKYRYGENGARFWEIYNGRLHGGH